MIVLVKFFCELVGEVGDDGRRERVGCLLNFLRISAQNLDKSYLLGAEFNFCRHAAKLDSSLGRLAQYRADSGVGVLYERTRVAVKID